MQRERARVSGVRVVTREIAPEEKKRKPFGERLTRNAMCALVALFCLATATNITLPSGRSVTQTLRDAVEYDWDDSLGRLTFVGNFLPESVQVFWTGEQPPALTAPCVGRVVHVWSEQEPYVGLESTSVVYACAPGEVTAVAHGENEERIVRVRHAGDLETVVYGLSACFVAVGDEVNAGSVLGLPGEDGRVYWEAKVDGVPRDASKNAAARESE